MKSAFNWLDNDGDGYVTEKDFDNWTTEMPKLFPDMTEEQHKMMLSTISNVWDNILEGKKKELTIRCQRTCTLKGYFGL